MVPIPEGQLLQEGMDRRRLCLADSCLSSLQPRFSRCICVAPQDYVFELYLSIGVALLNQEIATMAPSHQHSMVLLSMS